MREPEIVKAGGRADVFFESLRGFPLPHAGLYLLVPIRNEQEGYALIERLKSDEEDRRFGQPHYGHDHG